MQKILQSASTNGKRAPPVKGLSGQNSSAHERL